MNQDINKLFEQKPQNIKINRIKIKSLNFILKSYAKLNRKGFGTNEHPIEKNQSKRKSC